MESAMSDYGTNVPLDADLRLISGWRADGAADARAVLLQPDPEAPPRRSAPLPRPA
jgi:hypothetical protein